MPITTTDVCTNVVSGVEVTNNGATVVSCLSTGEYESINATLDTSIGYTTVEARLTNRFDDIYYYNVTSG
ncbi:hypothetical protein EB118_00670 [bacterium]|jgi:hypothetical protein|nr:hypothetical protein [bacterium]